jgi:hypothetical protein
MRSPEWHPLSPQAARQAADRSVAGSSFSDYRGQHNTARYRILTPLGYWVYVSEQRLYHINKHSQAAEHSDDLPHLLNNPDLITPNPDESATHLYYKVYRGTFVRSCRPSDAETALCGDNVFITPTQGREKGVIDER